MGTAAWRYYEQQRSRAAQHEAHRAQSQAPSEEGLPATLVPPRRVQVARKSLCGHKGRAGRASSYLPLCREAYARPPRLHSLLQGAGRSMQLRTIDKQPLLRPAAVPLQGLRHQHCGR